MARIAVTGGTGLVGRALIDSLIARGDRVVALVRDPARLPVQLQPRANLDIVRGDLDNKDALFTLMDGADAVVNCAGLTHALNAEAFVHVNVTGAGRVAHAANETGTRMVHISSLVARKPGLSAYARSKALSEARIAERAGVNANWITVRLPAIYGPGDLATLPYFKIVKRGFAPEPAAKPAPRVSILYVEDAAHAIMAAIDRAEPGHVYEVGDADPDGRSWQEIAEALGAVFGKKPRVIRLPKFVLMVYAHSAETAANLMRRPIMVSPGKIREFFHDDWVAHSPLLSDATGWSAATSLASGFAKTVHWYQEERML